MTRPHRTPRERSPHHVARHKIAPGIYDVDGEMHIVIPEILVELGMDVTPENVDYMTELLARQAAEAVPGTPVDVVDVGLADGTVVEAVVDDPPELIECDPACSNCDDAGCADCRPSFEDPAEPWEWS
jgi:hypothetical protein